MPSARALALSAVLIAVSAALIAPGAASSQDENGLSFLGIGTEPVTLTKGKPYRGDITLTLRNASPTKGDLRVRFITAQRTTVTAGQSAQAGVRMDFAPGTSEQIAPNTVQPLGLRLIADSEKAETLPSGALVVDFGDESAVPPASVAIKPPAAGKASFFQDSVETTVTRGDLWAAVMPGFLGGADDEGDLQVPVSGGGDTASTARLVSSRDGHLSVTLGAAEHDSAPLSVSGGPNPGSYSGKLQPPGADALSVTVHVQHWFLYPLLAVLLGALIGGLLKWAGGRLRTLRVVAKAIKDAVSEYDKKRPEKPESLESLDAALAWDPAQGKGISEKRYPRPWKYKTAETELAKLWRDLGRARWKGTDEAKDATDDANKLLAKITRWLRLKQAIGELADASSQIEEAEGLLELARIEHWSDETGSGLVFFEGPTPVREDTEALLAEPVSAEDEEAADAAVDRMSAQTTVDLLYLEAARLWTELDKSLGEHPVVLYLSFRREISRRPRETRRLTDRLSRLVRRWASELARRPDEPAPTDQQRGMAHLASYLTFAPSLDSVLRTVRAMPSIPIPKPLVADLRTPQEMLQSIRRWDWLIFLLKSLLIAIAYLLPFYIGKEFGSWDQYVTAVLAGVLGQVVIPWELFPHALSTELPEVKPAAEAA